MIKLIIGIGLIVAGAVTFFDPDIPVIWTGAFIVGAILVVSGIVQIARERRTAEELSQIEGKIEDLIERLQAEEPIDRIADEYYKEDEIPPIRTIQVTGYLIKSMLESGTEDERLAAMYLASKQVVDSDVAPAEAIGQFSFLDQVYFVDETASCFAEDPATSQGTAGTLILNKGFLFFFESGGIDLMNHPGVDSAMGRLEQAVPFLGIASAGYALVSGLSDELVEYFSDRKRRELEERFKSEGSRAMALVDVSQVGFVERKRKILATTYLEVSGSSSGEEWRVWFATSKVDEQDWAASWMERIQIACIAEGELLGASG